MLSLRKLMNKPRPDDWSPLAKFFYADEALNCIALELDSFDGRRDPERCNALVNKLRISQDRVLHIISMFFFKCFCFMIIKGAYAGEMLTIVYPRESDRACRDFRVKFPDEIIHDSLPGQLWFGAECLAAGSSIIDHESESDAIRPLAKELTRHLDSLRDLLKDQSLRDPLIYTDAIKESLLKFDHLFAAFEFQYVSAMVPVKSVKEHEAQLDVAVLFSDALERALAQRLISQEQIDSFDPIIMICIPRLAILWGLIYYPEGALNVDGPQENISEMFRPYYSLLSKIRNLLLALSPSELLKVEKILCTGETQMGEEDALTISVFRSNIDCNDSRVRKPFSNLQLQSFHCEENNFGSGTAAEKQHDIVNDCIATSDKRFGSIRNDYKSGLQNEMDVTEQMYTSANNLQEQRTQCSFDQTCISPSAYELRSKFQSADDLIHRLFVCISGVADQLQTNYSSEVRKVLKLILQPSEVIPVYEVSTLFALAVNGQTASNAENEEETGVEVQETLPLPAFVGVRWVPDEDCEQCTACSAPFTVVRRRHHCRNCGRIFCNKCSRNSMSIPELGYDRRVRVCNLCFLHRMNPFGNCVPGSQSTSAEVHANPAPQS
ncbi:FYVE zinc finger [Dictyocaulus viviparus]|uniref:FYVE zinc finger n=1 Tax=Dictyocaulus viviparus TaxID=29172 RepID=A0A0D8XJ76_DICVI|nr:FYVE zinc finger [Dictyocaulus viviparus]